MSGHKPTPELVKILWANALKQDPTLVNRDDFEAGVQALVQFLIEQGPVSFVEKEVSFMPNIELARWELDGSLIPLYALPKL